MIFWCGSGSPITPVDAMNTSWARHPHIAGSRFGDLADGLHSGRPGECIGIAAVGDQHTGRSAGQILAAPFDRRGGGFGLGEDARNLGSGREDHQPAGHCARRYRTFASPVARRTPASGGSLARLAGARGDAGFSALVAKPAGCARMARLAGALRVEAALDLPAGVFIAVLRAIWAPNRFRFLRSAD